MIPVPDSVQPVPTISNIHRGDFVDPYCTGGDVQVHELAFGHDVYGVAPATVAPYLIVAGHHNVFDQSQYEGMMSKRIGTGGKFESARFYYSGDVPCHDRVGIVTNYTTSVVDDSGRSGVNFHGVQLETNDINRAAPEDLTATKVDFQLRLQLAGGCFRYCRHRRGCHLDRSSCHLAVMLRFRWLLLLFV